MHDKVAVVTGAGAGIGRAIALRLAREGAAVVVADVDERGDEETAQRVEAGGGRAAFVLADVAAEADVWGRWLPPRSYASGVSTFWSITRVVPPSRTSPRRTPSTGDGRWT